MSNVVPPQYNYPPGGTNVRVQPTPVQPYYGATGAYNQPVASTDPKILIHRELERVVPDQKKVSFGTLEFRPQKVRFATQNKGERVYIIVRRHWITNVSWIIRDIFYSLLPFVILALVNAFSVNLDFVSTKALTILILFYLSIILTLAAKDFFDWFFDPYIVTNERVLDYDFKPFSSYTIKEASLANIENVKEDSAGIFENMFDYGNITILTASSTLKGELNFVEVPHPTSIRDVVIDLANIYKQFGYGGRRI